MRILMATQFYPPVAGGQERHVHDLAHALHDRGHEVEVATIATAPGVEDGHAHGTLDCSDGPVKVHRLRSATQRAPFLYSDPARPHVMPLADPGLRRRFHRLVADRFDIVHAHDWMVGSLLSAAASGRVPVVLTQHDYGHVCATKRMMRGGRPCPGPALAACVQCASSHYGLLAGPLVAGANAAARRARQRAIAGFVSVSDEVEALTLGDGRTGRDTGPPSEVIPNFVPDDIVLEGSAWRPADADAPILFAGDLATDKGVGVLFEAYRTLENPPPLVLIGRLLPETPPAPPGAECRGLVSPPTVRELMRSARFVVVPSVWPDPCPTVVLEAMASGRAVVGSATGGIRDLVADGDTGVLVAPGDPAALAAALSTLIGDPERTGELGRAGLARVRSFTASAVAGRIEAFYGRVISAAR